MNSTAIKRFFNADKGAKEQEKLMIYFETVTNPVKTKNLRNKQIKKKMISCNSQTLQKTKLTKINRNNLTHENKFDWRFVFPFDFVSQLFE